MKAKVKTKADLEKELKSTNAKLEAALKQIIKINQKDQEWKGIEPTPQKVESVKSTQPVFSEIIDSLNSQLRTQNELLEFTICKISNIDGGIGYDVPREKKDQLGGVSGCLFSLIELAAENRNRIEIINSRLVTLVG